MSESNIRPIGLKRNHHKPTEDPPLVDIVTGRPIPVPAQIFNMDGSEEASCDDSKEAPSARLFSIFDGSEIDVKDPFDVDPPDEVLAIIEKTGDLPTAIAIHDLDLLRDVIALIHARTQAELEWHTDIS